MSFIMRAMLVALALSFAPATLQAGTATDRLRDFFSAVKTLRSDFVQRVKVPGSNEFEVSYGQLLMQRPDRFRWDYTKPYQQQIVADGEKLWIYDTDLEQVIVKPLDQALANTPALLLSGRGSLDEQFTITELPAGETRLHWVRLLPKQTDAGFEEVMLGFDEQNLRMMELLDSFGQRTNIEFTTVERNPKIDAKVFRFTPPAGVDVIDEAARP